MITHLARSLPLEAAASSLVLIRNVVHAHGADGRSAFSRCSIVRACVWE